MLQNLYLFQDLPEDKLQKIDAISEIVTYGTGEDVFVQGDEAKALYVIQFGSVRIHQKSPGGDNVEITTLGTGSHFGEMAFIDGEPRSASATAIEKSNILEIDYKKLKELLVEDLQVAVHFYREFAHFLSGRLRITTNDLSFARSENLSHF